MPVRVGIGYDVHAFGEGGQLVLGGVAIPFEKGVVAHSDGDALAHAVIDALLGAAAHGDIGTVFPDTDEAYRDADSIGLLRQVWSRLSDTGWMLGNVDATVAVQRPKLRPYIADMRRNIATALGVDDGLVSVKATTTERLGFEGREEGIAVYAVCLLSAPEAR